MPVLGAEIPLDLLGRVVERVACGLLFALLLFPQRFPYEVYNAPILYSLTRGHFGGKNNVAE